MKKLIGAIAIMALITAAGCGPKINEFFTKSNKEYIKTLKTFRTNAKDSHETLRFEVAAIRFVVDFTLGMGAIPHHSFEAFARIEEISKKAKDQLTDEELAYIGLWKIFVFTPVTLDILGTFAPDALKLLANLGVLIL